MISRFARLVAAVLVLALGLLVSRDARAHKPSDAYLTLVVDGSDVEVRWDIALRDANLPLRLDRDGDGAITWGELESQRGALAVYARSRLALSRGATPCDLQALPGLAVADHSDGAYAVLRMRARCAGSGALHLRYDLFFDLDAQHRGVVRVDAAGRVSTFTVAADRRELDLPAEGGPSPLWRMVRDGVVHIFQGIDHILFLVALLLPSVLRRDGGRWVPVPGLRPALLDVLRIVTAFTIAHSITLSLAALGVVTLPARLVESAIAASVVVAAVDNLRPTLDRDRWAAAFLLGLMHGFGFSATLTDMDLPRSALVPSLFGFNLGVEVGQVAIVLAFVPAAFALRRRPLYQRGVLTFGSAVIAAVALVWLFQRAVLGRIS